MSKRQKMSKTLQGVHVISAQGLKDTDLFFTSDPYFICRIGSVGSTWDEKKVESGGVHFRSSTIKDSEDPEWDAKFHYEPLKDIMTFNVASTVGTADQAGKLDAEITIRIYGKFTYHSLACIWVGL